MNDAAPGFPRILTGLIPYGAVAIGLYALDSGFAAMGLYHAAVIVVLIAARYDVRSARTLSGWNTHLGVPLALACLIGCLGLYVLWPYMRHEGLELGDALAGLGLEGWAWLLFLPYYALVNPWVEEIFWRGYLGSSSKRLTLSDVLFAGYHALVLRAFMPWYINAPQVLGLVVVAWFWRQLGARLGGMAVVLAMHTAADLGIIVAAHLVAHGP